MKDRDRQSESGHLKWPPLLRGTLLRRYKRFIADVKLRNGHVISAHCPNSGSMLECSQPGRQVYLSRHHHPGRRLRYTWEIIEMPESMVGVNTLVPNRLVRTSIAAGKVPPLRHYNKIYSEVSYGKNSRLDLLLEHAKGPCLVEVKNCTLVTQGSARFPDAVTPRGLKHLRVLQDALRDGYRCVMFYLVQRMDARSFSPADHIDPDYGRELRKAYANGVEILVYDVELTLEQIRLRYRLPIVM